MRRLGSIVAACLLATACVPLDPNAPRPPATNAPPTNATNRGAEAESATARDAAGDAPGNASGNASGKVSDLAPGQHALVFERDDATAGRVNYLVYLPDGYDRAGARWPLILYLHGRSLRGDDVELVKRYGLPRRLEREKEFPFIVVSPQLRSGERWTDVDTLAALVDDVIERYPIDPERVYVTGYSMGGGGAWRVANAYPSKFAAVVALAGTADLGSVEGLARVPMWAIHGSNDVDTHPSNSVAMVEAIRAEGGQAELTLLPGRDHDILDRYDAPDVFDWMLRHARRGESVAGVAPRAPAEPRPERPNRSSATAAREGRRDARTGDR